MAVMEYVLVRGDKADTHDPFPMQGIELEAIAGGLGLTRSPRLALHPEDFAWEVIGKNSNIILTEVVYHPRLMPERIVVKAPEGGDLKTTFDLALALGEQLGANVFNMTTNEKIAHNFPGESAIEQQRAKEQEKLAARKGCVGSFLFLLP